jgi:NAD(P)-dependent dehydrogenase (short-subunit alcohol dehydrogenase family)
MKSTTIFILHPLKKRSMPVESLLADDVAIITGGASGNGREMALRFAAEGADVIIADIRESPREGGTPTHESIKNKTEADAAYVSCDVTNVDDLYHAVNVADDYGGVTIMVNNAGTTENRSFLETTESEYDQMIGINLKGVFFGTQAAAASMVEDDRSGSIINISSTSGLRGRANGVTYCASKGGVRLMTYALADALAPDIRVNAIHPDLTETEMANDLDMMQTQSSKEYVEEHVPLERTGKPKDVADAALYLASNLASFVTGHSLVIDGGVTATK